MGVRVLRGRYLVGGVVEEFACGAGPAGWRYTGARADGHIVDLTLDAAGRPYRLELIAGGWLLRGGTTGASLLWVRRAADGPVGEAAEQSVEAHAFVGDSPAFWVALARLAAPGERRLRVLEIGGAALATRTVDILVRLQTVAQRAPDGTQVPVLRCEVTALDTGESRGCYLSGEVVVSGDGIELLDLTG
jgi:hypothetical protein